MSQYRDFSRVYDLFMDNVPYEKWANDIVKILKNASIDSGIVLDLGCGTGTLTRLLADCGYSMIGIDGSDDMLAQAREKDFEVYVLIDGEPASDKEEILYLCQDIREFELYGTVNAVVSTCDTLNYITEYDDLLKVFKLVNNYLEPDGLFIFDMNAPEKYETTLADNVFAEDRDRESFIWENHYDSESRINEFSLILYLEDVETGLYTRAEEFHYQRAYTREEIANLLEEAGFRIIDKKEEEQRMYYVVSVIEEKKLGNKRVTEAK